MYDYEKNSSSAIAAIKRYSNFANGIKYDDWSVPTIGDLMQIYFAKRDHGLFTWIPAYSSGTYWSSCEYTNDTASYARNYDIGVGNVAYKSKGESYLVLPVRRF